jgi:hypothetical protein
VEDREVGAGDLVGAGEDGVLALQGDAGQGVVDASDADGAVVPVGGQLGEKAGGAGDPAQVQPGQGVGLGHAAGGDAAFVQVGDRGGYAVTVLVDAPR